MTIDEVNKAFSKLAKRQTPQTPATATSAIVRATACRLQARLAVARHQVGELTKAANAHRAAALSATLHALSVKLTSLERELASIFHA